MTENDYDALDLETAIEIIKKQDETIKELTRELTIAERNARYESRQKWRYISG